MSTVRDSDRPLARLPSWLRTLVTICGVEAGLALAYLLATDAGLAAPASLAIPFVWLTAGALAVWTVDTPTVSGWRRAVAVTVAVGYVAVLAWLTGTVSLSTGAATGPRLILLPPGWGPLLAWDGPVLAARLFPYKVLGDLALGYLVFVAVAELVGERTGSGDSEAPTGDGHACSLGGGLLAFTSCAGCSLPLVSWVLGGLGSVAVLGVGGGGLGGLGGLGSLGGLGGVGAASELGAGLPTYGVATAAYLLALLALTGRRRIASICR